MLRARVTGVSGRVTTLESFEDVRARGSLGREYTITYRDHLEANERIVDGAFWHGPSPEPEVSIEKGLHERFAINVGDVVRFDILGRVGQRAGHQHPRRGLQGRARRRIHVRLQAGTLEAGAADLHRAAQGPGRSGARGRSSSTISSRRFPNVSVIDFHEILETIRDVMSKVTLAITVVGGLVLFSGVLILVGAVAMTKFQRVYEAAVFKTLGANTRTIATMLLVEYGVLGFAGGPGRIGRRRRAHLGREPLRARHSVAGVSRRSTSAASALTAALVAAIGVLSSLDVLGNKPLATLRAE